MSYKLRVGGVHRLRDGAYIPNSMDSRDWREYQEWLKAGNIPDPADPPPPPPTNQDLLDWLELTNKAMKAFILLVADQHGFTPAQVRDAIKAKMATL